jgi:hypothetical protein
VSWRAVSSPNPYRFISADVKISRLAYCELYIMTAAVALRVLPRAKLYDTTVEDLTYDHDLIVVQTKKGSISVKITID